MAWSTNLVTIWFDHKQRGNLRIDLIRLLIVVYGMWSVLFQWLCKVAGYWWTWNTVVHVDPESPKHSQLVTNLVSLQAI